MEVLSEDELIVRGTALGRSIASGSVVLLEGDLAAGKTTFVRAVVQGLGATDAATSPTYALVHHYEGPRGPIYHVDCYRLRSPDEAADLDWEDLVRGDVLLVEWPERAGSWVPRATHRFRLSHDANPDRRTLEELPVGAPAR